MYVCQLPEAQQAQIRSQLVEMGIEGEDLQNAMDSKLDDLREVLGL
jgi:hypothetical protein